MSQNENTPQYMKTVPWYAQKQGKQSTTEKSTKAELQQWYDRGARGYQATNYRKGACENCGAMGHARKQCTQRPRKIAAKFSTKNIAPDDVTKDLDLNWEGKRDRWNGYDAEMYKEVIEEYQQYEEIRKKNKEDEGVEDIDKEFKHSVDPTELANLPTKHAKNKKYQGLGGVRNRQDYAKYLLNLDVNSDHFDPKSRTMSSYDNPDSQLNNLEVIGERDQLRSQQKFASEQVELHNSELSTVALPTLTEKIYKKIKENKQNASSQNKTQEIIKKYGENAGNKPLDIVEEDEQFFDYGWRERKIVKSRYEQDVLINDHLSVWGSWYNKLLGWGFACCHSTDKFSYCLGNKGKEKALAAELKAKAQKLREQQQLEEAAKRMQQKEQKKQTM